MQTINRLISVTKRLTTELRHETLIPFPLSRTFSTTISGSSSSSSSSYDNSNWETPSTWSTGLTKDHFNGEATLSDLQEMEEKLQQLEQENRQSKSYVDSWKQRMTETCLLLKQVHEPGARGSYLKDSEKAEMYRLHKKNPEVYTVEKLAKDYRIMRQRVHAILWLKELEEEEEKKLGQKLDDSVEILLDTFPEFFISHDREFHVASLPYKPDFKVMPEGWDGITKDLDEVHYEISKKEDDMLYRDFVEKMNFNKKKMAGEVKCHKYSRRRPEEGWTFTVEKMGSRGKRGGGGGWKFASMPDGSTRPLNEMEKMYVRRETPRRRRRILP
ncbi:Translation initiation factor eIF-2B subunit gamma [Trifolium repens]|nr:Translation initiation factor eIF-2B subunit gamma [Trifolium repens]